MIYIAGRGTAMMNDRCLSAVFSNLTKAAALQQNEEISSLFDQLAQHYTHDTADAGGFDTLQKLIGEDLRSTYASLAAAAGEKHERGPLRALTWGEKVTKIQKSLISRYERTGESLLEDTEVFICEACGFISIGKAKPKLCPICKAPESRFSQVE
ncbi:MAG: rubredoxin [Spirochaetia bacterium]|nr:rubredoxin [Spirochaetia bacterium]